MRSNSFALLDLARRSLSTALGLSLCIAPLPALASNEAPAPEEKKEEAAPENAAQAGGAVALLRFTGEAGAASELREGVQNALEVEGYEVKGVKRDINEAAKKNKCRDIDDKCLGKIGKYLNKNAKTPFNFFIYGETAGAGGQGKVVVWDIDKEAKVADTAFTALNGDYVLPSAVSVATARATRDYQVPPGPLSAEEQKIMDELDEPKKTAEQLEAEKKALAGSVADTDTTVDVGKQEVDLRKDFKDFCRKGPREDKIIQNVDGTTDKQRDPRPVCKRGPVFGYFQPRSWVAMTLTIGSLAGMGVMYGLALGARMDWKKAKDDLDDSGLTPESDAANPVCSGAQQGSSGGQCYADYAGAVSDAGQKVRTRAIVGDVLLGTSVLMAGIFAIIVSQDRKAARLYMESEKELRMSDLRIGPMIGGEAGNGLAASFRF